MDRNQPNRFLTSFNNISKLRSTAFIGVLSLTLLSCGGGSGAGALPPPPIERNPCASNQLQKSGGGCVSASAISVDNIDGADGLDLTNNGIPELVFIAPINDPTTGIDFNGDGIIDYYLLIDADGKQSLHTDRAGTSDTVTIITDTNNNPQGFNEGNNKTNTQLKTILANTATPIVSTNFSGKINGVGNKQYQSAPNVSINCDASSTCNAISYIINDATNSEPNFKGIGTIIMGGTVPADILLLAKNSNGDSLDGIYTLKFIARSATNKLSTIQTEIFEINSTACATPPIPVINVTSITPNNIEDATANKYGISANFINSVNNTFTLDGSASTPNNRNIDSYSWKQIPRGDEKIITASSSSANNAVQTFKIPSRITTLNYLFSVTDSFGCTASTTATIYVMKNPTSAFFIDANSPVNSLNPGTRKAPFKTVQAAIQQNTINVTNFDLYMATKENNTNYIEPPLIIADGISLFGGFDNNWNRDVVRTKTKILVKKDITNDPHLRAIDFQDINSDTWLTGFDITALLAPVTASSESNIFAVHATGAITNTATLNIRDNIISAGDALTGNNIGTGSSYGVYVSTVTNTIIELNTISSGKSGNGKTGDDGITGKPGFPGSNGISATELNFEEIALGGAGGVLINNPEMSGKNGGDGGGYYLIPSTPPGLIHGKSGIGNCSGIGANSIRASSGQIPPPPHAKLTLTRGDPLTPNCQLLSKPPLIHNSNAGFKIGTFDILYNTSNGENGNSGINGLFGGSGGGGGGAVLGSVAFGQAGSGGGGGSAGFGGSGGNAGIGGGASIAIYIQNTFASILNNFNITSNNAGNAGSAGIGGLGGKGGVGGTEGIGSTQQDTSGIIYISGNGSAGENGDPGSTGSDASGGGGGPSLGIFISASLTPTITGNTITTGNGGNGGNARHGAAGDGGVSYGIYSSSPTVIQTNISNNIISFGNAGLGGSINPDTTTTPATPGTGLPGVTGIRDQNNFTP